MYFQSTDLFLAADGFPSIEARSTKSPLLASICGDQQEDHYMSTAKTNENNSFLLEGLLEQDPAVLEQIYDQCFPKLQRFITRRKGSREDAEDVFQEALASVYERAQEGLELTSSFPSYLFAVGKFTWFRMLQKRRPEVDPILLHTKEDPDPSISAILSMREQDRFIKEKFAELKEPCRQVLSLFFKGWKMAEIADQLNYGSRNYAKKKKWMCFQALLDLVRADPRYHELK